MNRAAICSVFLVLLVTGASAARSLLEAPNQEVAHRDTYSQQQQQQAVLVDGQKRPIKLIADDLIAAKEQEVTSADCAACRRAGGDCKCKWSILENKCTCEMPHLAQTQRAKLDAAQALAKDALADNNQKLLRDAPALTATQVQPLTKMRQLVEEAPTDAPAKLIGAYAQQQQQQKQQQMDAAKRRPVKLLVDQAPVDRKRPPYEEPAKEMRPHEFMVDVPAVPYTEDLTAPAKALAAYADVPLVDQAPVDRKRPPYEEAVRPLYAKEAEPLLAQKEAAANMKSHPKRELAADTYTTKVTVAPVVPEPAAFLCGSSVCKKQQQCCQDQNGQYDCYTPTTDEPTCRTFAAPADTYTKKQPTKLTTKLTEDLTAPAVPYNEDLTAPARREGADVYANDLIMDTKPVAKQVPVAP